MELSGAWQPNENLSTSGYHSCEEAEGSVFDGNVYDKAKNGTNKSATGFLEYVRC